MGRRFQSRIVGVVGVLRIVGAGQWVLGRLARVGRGELRFGQWLGRETGHNMRETGHNMRETGHNMRETGHNMRETGHNSSVGRPATT